MAPRKKEDRKSKSAWERTGRTLSTGAGMFDLREDRAVPEEERPYRERHRVEVSVGRPGQDRTDPQGYRYGTASGNRGSSARPGQDRSDPQGYRYGTASGNRAPSDRPGSRELATDLLSNGGYSGKVRGDEDRNRGRETRVSGRRSAPREIVRGNAPGRYRRTGGDVSRQTGMGVSQQTGRVMSRKTGGGVSRQAAPSPRPGRASRNLEEYRRRIRQIDIDVDSYDREYDPRGRERNSRDSGYDPRGRGHDLPFPPVREPEEIRREDTPDRAGSSDRESRREAARREREKQVRRMYIRLGAAGAVLVLVLLLLFGTAHRLLRKKGSPAAAETTLARDQADPRQETDAPGEETDPGTELTPPGQDMASGQEAGGEDDGEASGRETDEASQGEAAVHEAAVHEEGGESKGADNTDRETGGGGQGEAVTQKSGGEDDGEASGQDTGEESGGEAAAQGAGAQKPAAGETGSRPENAGTGENPSYTRQDEWNLIVVNPWTALPADYTFETTSLPNGESVDSRCYGALTQMLEACRSAGNVPVVCSSFRTHEKQIGLFEDQVNAEMAKGLDREEAEREAATTVARPGTSEHELGLAVDICDNNYQSLDENQAHTSTQQWLMAHCWEYGFILRYPVGRGEVTGIIFEPWHYRYVGEEAARDMFRGGNWLCLEEYLAP